VGLGKNKYLVPAPEIEGVNPVSVFGVLFSIYYYKMSLK
jgi:hypothetical protein